MEPENAMCQHKCRNTCAMLVEALRRETALMHLYEELLNGCDDPQVRKLVEGLMEKRTGTVDRIVSRLNEISARSEILDGINNSFNPPGRSATAH